MDLQTVSQIIASLLQAKEERVGGGIVLYCTVQSVLYCTVLSVLYCTVLSVLYCTVLSCPELWRPEHGGLPVQVQQQEVQQRDSTDGVHLQLLCRAGQVRASWGRLTV